MSARAMAVLNNLGLELLPQRGVTNVPHVRRCYTANLEHAVALILQSKAQA